MQSQLVNRPALGVHPTPQFIKQIDQILLPIAPKGLEHVQPMMCGSCSNENAFKAMCMWYANKTRQGKAFTDEELQSSMFNKAPGCPSVSIMSFEGAFHGRTFGKLKSFFCFVCNFLMMFCFFFYRCISMHTFETNS